jgi:hypothetical protein
MSKNFLNKNIKGKYIEKQRSQGFYYQWGSVSFENHMLFV